MSSTTPAGGVIHDIGYRHYEGERLGRSFIRRSLFADSLKAAFGLGRGARYKVMPMILFAVMCVPAGAMVAITAVVDADELVGGYTAYVLNLQMIVLVFVASQAPVAVSRDLRFGVMSLYFSRPLERLDYVASKYAAMTSALFVIAATPLTILFAGALVVGLPLGEQVPDFLRAAVASGLLALILAGIGLAIASITPRKGFAVGAIIAFFLVLTGVQAFVQELALSEGLDEVAPYLSLISPFTLVQGIQSSLLGATTHPVPSPSDVAGGLVFLAEALVLIALSFSALVLRYRSVST